MSDFIPASAQELTPEFLTELIGVGHPGVVVTAARVVDIKGYGEINVSTSARVTLDLEYGPPSNVGLPRRIIAKMSLADSVWCAHLHSFFENEVNFYRRIRPQLDIETPLALGGRYNPTTQRYVLLLEDVGVRGAHFSSMIDDATPEDIQSVLDTHAKLHARFWQSPRFATDLSWVQSHMAGEVEALMHTLVRSGIQQEVAHHKFKRELIGSLGSTEERLHTLACALKRHQSTLPQTLLHGDSHIGNTYRLPGGMGGLYDWQLSVRGYAMHDVTYVITTGLSIELRRRHERELIAFYRDRLRAYGVAEPGGSETLWLEHRRATLWTFYYGWLPCPAENYGWELLTVAHLRTAAACQDHDTLQVVAELL